MFKLRNIIIFLVIAVVIGSVYVFFVKPDDSPETSLVSTRRFF
jgi:hypothetical protein